jgi:hypothetical protein
MEKAILKNFSVLEMIHFNNCIGISCDNCPWGKSRIIRSISEGHSCFIENVRIEEENIKKLDVWKLIKQ